MVPVQCYFVLSALLFFIGVYGFVTRRNLIAMLISVELVLNAVDINFAAFNRLLFPEREVERTCVVTENQNTDEEEHISKTGYDERLLAGMYGSMKSIVETDEQI